MAGSVWGGTCREASRLHRGRYKSPPPAPMLHSLFYVAQSFLLLLFTASTNRPVLCFFLFSSCLVVFACGRLRHSLISSIQRCFYTQDIQSQCGKSTLKLSRACLRQTCYCSQRYCGCFGTCSSVIDCSIVIFDGFDLIAIASFVSICRRNTFQSDLWVYIGIQESFLALAFPQISDDHVSLFCLAC